MQIDFQKCNCWCKRGHVERDALKDGNLNIFQILDRRISFYSQNTNMLPRKPKISYRYLKSGIEECHRKHENWFQHLKRQTTLLLFDGCTTLIL